MEGAKGASSSQMALTDESRQTIMAEAVAARDSAIAGFFTELAGLAKVATTLVQELEQQTREEAERTRRRRSSP